MNTAPVISQYAPITQFVACMPRKEKQVINYPTQRRAPGGLKLAVLFAVGEGYETSGKVAELLGTCRDNVNNALARLLDQSLVARWGETPVQWQITNLGRQRLKNDLWEVGE